MKTFECKPWLIWKARKENYCWARICCHSLAETIHVFWEAFALSYLIHCERPSWQHLSTLVQFLFSSLCHKRNKHLAHIHLSQHTTYSPELHNKLSQGYRIQSLWRKSINRWSCTTTEKAPTRPLLGPTRAFSWLKAPTCAFTFKTLLRHYAKRALTPR